MKRLIQRLKHDERGAAAIELAAVATVFALGAMNTAEVARYAYQTSEVNAAAQAGAEAAVVLCDLAHTPATVNCSNLNSTVTTAIQSTRLGSAITLDGPITEAYYCLDSSRVLHQAGSVSSKPSDCSSVANAAVGAAPTLYLQVHVTSPFVALFPGLTITQTFTANIARTAWMRMA